MPFILSSVDSLSTTLMYTTCMGEITSLQNPKVKQIVKLREDKRQRNQDRLTIVEGSYELEVALASGISPQEVYYCNEYGKTIPKPFQQLNIIPVSQKVFKKVSRRENPDGWLAIVSIPNTNLTSVPVSENPFLLLVEAIEKPGNLGAILRTADAAGVDGILVCDPRVGLFSPNVVRASRGALFSVPVAETDGKSALRWLREMGIFIIATSPDADTCYNTINLNKPICILVGTENEGLGSFWMKNADVLVTIPMVGKVNSLNVSTSTAILLFEVVRQRNLIINNI